MKLCAILFTVGWAAALVFGWLAIAAPPDEPAAFMAINLALSAMGAAMGMWSWVVIARH